MQLALALLGLAEFGDLPRLGFLGHDHERSAGLGYAGESEYFHRCGRRRLGHALAVVIEHRAHASIGDATDERIALAQRAFLDQHGRDRTASAIEFRFDHRAARRTIRVGLELEHVGLQQQHLEQLVDTYAGARGDGHYDRVAAVVLGDKPLLGELLLDPVDVGLGPVDLVDRHHDRHLGRARVVERLDRLRHHALVGRDYQDHDVRDLGAARAHRGERLVTGSIDESYLAPIGLDRVRADMLRDSAELLLGDLGVADRVEERGLAVIDVAHHGDHRRARDHLAHGLFGLALLDRGFDVEGDVLDAVAELVGDQRRGVDVEHLVERRHHAEVHQLLDDLAGFDAHVAREFGDGDALGYPDHALGGLGRGDLGLALFLAGQRAPLLGHAQAAHLALGGEVGRALFDHALFLDRPRAGLGRAVAGRRHHALIGLRGRRGRRRKTRGLAGTRWRAGPTDRRRRTRRRFGQLYPAQHPRPALAVVERRRRVMGRAGEIDRSSGRLRACLADTPHA